MLSFFLIIGLASIVGVIFGIVSVLKSKKIPLGRAVIYSFLLFTMPLLIISAHIQLYKERHDLFEKYLKAKKVSDINLPKLRKTLDSNAFKFLIFAVLLKDIVTPKDNIILLVKFAVEYDKKYVLKKSYNNQNVFEKVGLLGVLKKALLIISNSLKTQASEEMMLKRYVSA